MVICFVDFVFIVIYCKGLGAVHKLCLLDRGEEGSPKDDLLYRPYLIKKTTRGGRGSKIADFETT